MSPAASRAPGKWSWMRVGEIAAAIVIAGVVLGALSKGRRR